MPGRELKRVLVVEDDPDIQLVAELALSELGGMTVKLCASGKAALQEAPQFRPDLILLDLMMPGMDGAQTLRALRERPDTAAIPVVFLTARFQPHDVPALTRSGSLGVIAKPFDPATLAETLHRLWSEQRG